MINELPSTDTYIYASAFSYIISSHPPSQARTNHALMIQKFLSEKKIINLQFEKLATQILEHPFKETEPISLDNPANFIAFDEQTRLETKKKKLG